MTLLNQFFSISGIDQLTILIISLFITGGIIISLVDKYME
jgi:hypothetical protein